MSKDNASRAEVKSFIRAYFEHDRETIEPQGFERKGYKVFKARVAALKGKAEGSDLPVTPEGLAALYELVTGKSATYEQPIAFNPRPENVTRALEHVTLWAYEMLDSYPQSVTDLCERGKSSRGADDYTALRKYYWHNDNYGPVRECFREMAKRGLVGMHEVKTCGRCHIRVYYRL